MKTILVPIDFSDCVPDLTAMAVRLAKAFGARLVLLHVSAPEPEFIGYEPGPQSVRDSIAQQFAELHRRMHNLEALLADEGVAVTALTIQGYPVDKILEQSIKWEADLIVMGSHGHGALYTMLVGSVTEGVMHKSNGPVMVVPHRARRSR
jgi:nucleotide-binding universal stress UspA family protein